MCRLRSCSCITYRSHLSNEAGTSAAGADRSVRDNGHWLEMNGSLITTINWKVQYITDLTSALDKCHVKCEGKHLSRDLHFIIVLGVSLWNLF